MASLRENRSLMSPLCLSILSVPLMSPAVMLALRTTLYPPSRATDTQWVRSLSRLSLHFLPAPPLASRLRSDPAPRDRNFRDAPGKKFYYINVLLT